MSQVELGTVVRDVHDGRISVVILSSTLRQYERTEGKQAKILILSFMVRVIENVVEKAQKWVFPINSDTTGLMTRYDNVDDDVQALSNGKKNIEKRWK